MARLALASGDRPSALAFAAEILAYLDQGGTLAAADEPQLASLTCIQVLKVLGDPRAANILEHGYAQLQHNASRILDEPCRRSYLDNVPWRREIIKLWQDKQSHRDTQHTEKIKINYRL